jgi:hypothetical protein
LLKWLLLRLLTGGDAASSAVFTLMHPSLVNRQQLQRTSTLKLKSGGQAAAKTKAFALVQKIEAA